MYQTMAAFGWFIVFSPSAFAGLEIADLGKAYACDCRVTPAWLQKHIERDEDVVGGKETGQSLFQRSLGKGTSRGSIVWFDAQHVVVTSAPFGKILARSHVEIGLPAVPHQDLRPLEFPELGIDTALQLLRDSRAWVAGQCVESHQGRPKLSAIIRIEQQSSASLNCTMVVGGE